MLMWVCSTHFHVYSYLIKALCQSGMHVSGHNDKLETDKDVAIIKTAAAEILYQNLLRNIHPHPRLINMIWRNL